MTDISSRTYAVAGMTCDHCAAAVASEVTKIEGISDVVVDLNQGTLTFAGDIPREAVAEAVEEAGYELG